MIQITIGTVMTRWAMTCGTSVPMQPEPLEQQEQRDQVGQARRHAGDEHDDGRLASPHAGDAVAGRHADQRARAPVAAPVTIRLLTKNRPKRFDSNTPV